MVTLGVDGLPAAPLAAAADFHARILAQAEAALADGDLTLVFAPADHTHRGWRLAVVQGLARAHTPRRVNAVESDSAAAISGGLAYLAAAPGVTGQVLRLDSQGAGPVVG